jgi:hypothetical protein
MPFNTSFIVREDEIILLEDEEEEEGLPAGWLFETMGP